jgi:PAS domain S-box-containing protein
MDLTPPSFALSAIVVAYGLIRFKLFDLVPIARDMVVEEMSDGVIVLNHEDIIIDMNSAALSIFNIGRREVLGQPVRDILQEWQLYVDRYKDIREISEQLIFGTDTNRIYYDFRISPLYNRRHVFCGRLIQLRNITALKSAEAELRESENTLKTIFLAAPIGIGYIQHEKLVWANDRFFNMMDYSIEEKIESINLCFETPEEFDRVKKTIKEEISAIGVCDVESRLKTRSGRIIDALLRTALMTRSDDSRGLIFAAVDMTERKRMMKEIQRVQNLESIGVLAGGIAHDFNNILTAILGNLSLARLYSPQKDRTYDKILEAEKASERAKTLTNQLLTFSKGGIPVKTTTTIDGLLKESTLFALTGSNVKCEFEIPANLWSVDADAGQINQVIHNLILNADQSMPDGGILSVRAQNIQVEIGQSLPLKPGRYVKVTVEDHGIGIPQEYLHRIFDPYFTTKSKGSGLGLAMVHSIIKNHGGYVTVESQLGQGARFSFYLPAVSGKKITCTDEEQPISGSGKILIMDDEEEVRKVSKEILETLGYDSVLTCNGQEAIESYSTAMKTNDPFAGVIMDLTIPGGMGGKEAVKKILFIDPNAKVIVASGYSNDPVMADYRQYGFKGVITKPFTIKDLSLILKKVLE